MEFNHYDKLGVRAFVTYAANGAFGIELYRRKTPKESKGDHDWKMIRIGHVQSYYTRREAEVKAIELCEETYQEYLTNGD